MSRDMTRIKATIYKILYRPPAAFISPATAEAWTAFINSFSDLGYCRAKSLKSEITPGEKETIENGKKIALSCDGKMEGILLQTAAEDYEAIETIKNKETDILLLSHAGDSVIFYPAAILAFGESVVSGETEAIPFSYEAEGLESEEQFRRRLALPVSRTYSQHELPTDFSIPASFTDDFTRNDNSLTSKLNSFTLPEVRGHPQTILYNEQNSKIYIATQYRDSTPYEPRIYIYDYNALTQEVSYDTMIDLSSLGSSYHHPAGLLFHNNFIYMLVSGYPSLTGSQIVKIDPADNSFEIETTVTFNAGAMANNGNTFVCAANGDMEFKFLNPSTWQEIGSLSYADLWGGDCNIDNMVHLSGNLYLATIWDQRNTLPTYAPNCNYGKYVVLSITPSAYSIVEEHETTIFMGTVSGQSNTGLWLGKGIFAPFFSSGYTYVFNVEDWEDGNTGRIFIGDIRNTLLDAWGVRMLGYAFGVASENNLSTISSNNLRVRTHEDGVWRGFNLWPGFNHNSARTERYMNAEVDFTLEVGARGLIGYYGIEGTPFCCIYADAPAETLTWRSNAGSVVDAYSISAATPYKLRFTLDRTTSLFHMDFCLADGTVVASSHSMTGDSISGTPTDQTGFKVDSAYFAGDLLLSNINFAFSDTGLVTP